MRQKSLLSLSSQATAIYSLLLKRGSLTAEQIGRELSIFPQAVYRNIHLLKKLGCIETLKSHPAQFQAKSVLEAVEAYSLLHREWFLKTFLNSLSNEKNSNSLQLSFLDSRDHHLEKYIEDIGFTNQEANIIISGHGVTAEVNLASKQAFERGVVGKMLVQSYDATNEDLIKSWQRIGWDIRLTKPHNARILILDQKIVYIMSYNPADTHNSTGIRFEYAPLGRLMNTLFMKEWQRAKPI